MSDLALSIVLRYYSCGRGARRCREMLEAVGDAVVPRARIIIVLAVLEAMRRDFDEARSLSGSSIAMLEEFGHWFTPRTPRWRRAESDCSPAIPLPPSR